MSFYEDLQLSSRLEIAIMELKNDGIIKTQADIARDLGYKRVNTISDLLTNRATITTKFVKSFSSKYGFNELWLKEGKGEMKNVGYDYLKSLLSTSEKASSAENDLSNETVSRIESSFQNDTNIIPSSGVPHTTKGGNEMEDLGNGFYRMTVQLVSQKSAAGYLSGWGDQEYLEELPTMTVIVKQAHKGTYRAFEIAANNNSMDDGTKRSIEAGDVVIDRLINRSLWATSKLHLSKWKVYTIVHRYEGVTTKEIINHDVERGIITCHSWNEDKEMYPDFELNLADVFQLWNVVKIEKNL